MQSGETIIRSLSETVDVLLKCLCDNPGISPRLRSASRDIYGLYHTGIRTDILNVLLPIIHRLRKRIHDGDANYFSSKAFIDGVSKAVEQRCKEVVANGKMSEAAMSKVGPGLQPLLEAIQATAQNYINGDGATFEFMLERMTEALVLLEKETEEQ
jgi:hypothetical protein